MWAITIVAENAEWASEVSVQIDDIRIHFLVGSLLSLERAHCMGISLHHDETMWN